MMYMIEQVRPLPDFSLELTYSDAIVTVVSFKPFIEKGGVFTSLADSQFFNQVKLGEHGRYIVWPGELDFCADSFRVGKMAEVAPEEALSAKIS